MSNIVEKAKAAGDFICGDDGFYVYWPKGYGALSEQDLYLLHRELIRMNAKWEDDLNEYFRTGPGSEASGGVDGGQACGEDDFGISTTPVHRSSVT